MAKRRKEKDEEEDKPFKPGKFDREKYIKQEKRNVKSVFIAFFFGILMAIICFGFWALMGPETGMRWFLVIILAIFSSSFIKYFYLKLNLDTSHFTKKNWFAAYAVYFFAWLLVFIILVNPPIYDDEPPVVELVVLPEMQEPGGDILFVAKITDNVEVDKDSLKIDITYPDDTEKSVKPSEFEQNDIIVKFLFENTDNQTGEFTYILTAKDVNGHVNNENKGSFYYDDDVIDVDETLPSLKSMSSDDDIDIEVDEKVSKETFRVYYKLDSGEEINVNRYKLDYPEKYETSPAYEGWEQNSNYTMKVYVEVSHYFPNIFIKYSNIVEDTEEYNVSTTGDDDIGDETPPQPWNWSKSSDEQADVLLNYDSYDQKKPKNEQVLLPYPHTVKVPGFVTVIFLLAIIAVIFIFKYKKKDKKQKK